MRKSCGLFSYGLTDTKKRDHLKSAPTINPKSLNFYLKPKTLNSIVSLQRQFTYYQYTNNLFSLKNFVFVVRCKGMGIFSFLKKK